MKSSAAYRDAAWNSLSGNWGSAVVFTLVYFVIDCIVSLVDSTLGFGGSPETVSSLNDLILLFAGSLVTVLLTAPVVYSYEITFLDNQRNGKALSVQALFEGYNDYLRITGTYLLICVYVFLWSLLLVVPGIIKSISYSQIFYILRDEPSLTYNRAIERSVDIMYGHKMDYFLLILSFIGWYILGIITLGIGFLWIKPYVSKTMALFYEDLKSEYENKTIA